MKTTLELVLKYRWFCLICHGVKRNEYRDLNTYWRARLLNKDGSPRRFEVVRFRWGYAKHAPEMIVQWLDTRIDKKRQRFEIQLGPVFSRENCENITPPDADDLLAHAAMECPEKMRRFYCVQCSRIDPHVHVLPGAFSGSGAIEP